MDGDGELDMLLSSSHCQRRTASLKAQTCSGAVAACSGDSGSSAILGAGAMDGREERGRAQALAFLVLRSASAGASALRLGSGLASVSSLALSSASVSSLALSLALVDEEKSIL